MPVRGPGPPALGCSRFNRESCDWRGRRWRMSIPISRRSIPSMGPQPRTARWVCRIRLLGIPHWPPDPHLGEDRLPVIVIVLLVVGLIVTGVIALHNRSLTYENRALANQASAEAARSKSRSQSAR